MNVINVSAKLDEIKTLWAAVRECPLYKTVASAAEVEEMRQRIESVFDRYDVAIEDDEQRICQIRKELNRIIFTLRRWLYYDDLEAEKRICRYLEFL